MNQKNSTEIVEPILQYCIFCDAIATDPAGKPVFVGVFDYFKKPTQIPQFFIVLRWVNGLGEHTVQMRMLDPDLKEIFNPGEKKINLSHKTQGVQGVYQFVNFVFPTSGVYWIEISLNDRIYSAIPLPVYDS